MGEKRFNAIGDTMKGVIFDSGPLEINYQFLINAMKFTFPKRPFLFNAFLAGVVLFNFMIDPLTRDWKRFVNQQNWGPELYLIGDDEPLNTNPEFTHNLISERSKKTKTFGTFFKNSCHVANYVLFRE